MFTSNQTKFLLVAFFIAIHFSACGFKKTEDTKPVSQTNASEAQTSIPFSNKEPKTFQTEVIVTTLINDKKIEKKYFIARDGDKRFIAFNYKSENETAILQTESNKNYLIKRKDKTYLERIPTVSNSGKNKLQNFLTTKWLNEKKEVSFEKMETLNNQTKFRAKFEDSKNTEIFIYVDEKLGLPIKQEFFTILKDKRIKTMSVEFSNFKLETDAAVFELPENYRDEREQ